MDAPIYSRAYLDCSSSAFTTYDSAIASATSSFACSAKTRQHYGSCLHCSIPRGHLDSRYTAEDSMAVGFPNKYILALRGAHASIPCSSVACPRGGCCQQDEHWCHTPQVIESQHKQKGFEDRRKSAFLWDHRCRATNLTNCLNFWVWAHLTPPQKAFYTILTESQFQL